MPNEKPFKQHAFREIFRTELKKIDPQELVKKLSFTSTSAFRQWVNGYSMPTCENLMLIAEFFNCTTDYLIGLSDTRNYDDFYTSFGEFQELALSISKLSDSASKQARDAIDDILCVFAAARGDVDLETRFSEFLSAVEKMKRAIVGLRKYEIDTQTSHHDIDVGVQELNLYRLEREVNYLLTNAINMFFCALNARLGTNEFQWDKDWIIDHIQEIQEVSQNGDD